MSIIVPIVTPCIPSGELDLGGLKAVCKDMVSAGCNSIFAVGSSGRGPWFSRDDRARICHTIAEQTDCNVPVPWPGAWPQGSRKC